MRMELLRSVTGRVLVEAHGGSSVGPPNSWTAIEHGNSLGADLIEVDVQTSEDGVLFLYHNYVLPDGRWTHLTGWQELRDVRFDGEGLVLLEDLMSWATARAASLVLDIKSGFRPPGTVHDGVAKQVCALAAEDRTILSDRDHKEIKRVKEIHPNLRTRASLGARLADLDGVVRFTRPDVVTMRWDLCRGDDIEVAHGLGVAVAFVDGWHPDYFAGALHLGADIVTWRDPAEARERLRAAGA